MIVEIRNFKCFEKFEAEISEKSIILGENGIGKTSLLEAIFLFPDPREDVLGTSKLEIVKELHDTSDNRIFLRDYIYPVKISIDNSCLEMVPKENKIKLTFNRKEIGELCYTCSSIIQRSSERVLFSSKLFGKFKKYIENRWEEIVQRKIAKEFAKIVSENFREKFFDLAYEKFLGINQITFIREDGTRVRLDDIADGIKTLFYAFCIIKLLNPKIVLWDDIECYLSPAVYHLLLNILEDVSVIATTHNIQVAEMFGHAGYSIYIMTGETLREISTEELEKLKKLGLDIRMAWKVIL